MLENQVQVVDVSTRIDEYEDRKVRVKSIIFSQNNLSTQLDLFLDLHKDLLLCSQMKATDPNNNIVLDGQTKFEYPEHGPRDIYELGVPKDAKIINNLPTEDS